MPGLAGDRLLALLACSLRVALLQSGKVKRGLFAPYGCVSRVNNLEESCVRTSLNFLSGLVLYGMRYVHCVKIWTAERRSLGPRSRLELPSGDGLSLAKILSTPKMARFSSVTA